MPVALPAEHPEAGHAEARERRADEIGHGAEIFGDDLGAGAAEQIEHTLAERKLRRLVGRREEAVAAVARPSVGAIEADEVIDAIAVVQIGAAARALAQPAVIAPRPARPSDRRACPSPGRSR